MIALHMNLTILVESICILKFKSNAIPKLKWNEIQFHNNIHLMLYNSKNNICDMI